MLQKKTCFCRLSIVCFQNPSSMLGVALDKIFNRVLPPHLSADSGASNILITDNILAAFKASIPDEVRVRQSKRLYLQQKQLFAASNMFKCKQSERNFITGEIHILSLCLTKDIEVLVLWSQAPALQRTGRRTCPHRRHKLKRRRLKTETPKKIC